MSELIVIHEIDKSCSTRDFSEVKMFLKSDVSGSFTALFP